MLTLNSIIQKFEQKGEKTGWMYIDIPQSIAHEIKANCKKSFRVKGFLNNLEITGVALLPMGNGDFILPINAKLRKTLGKKEGETICTKLQEHKDYELPIPDYLFDCLAQQDVLEQFNKLTKSHRDYFIKWIIAAKTNDTQVKRITNTIDALIQNKNYGEMLRSLKVK